MIIDPHVHIGHDTTWDSNRTEDEVFDKMNEVGIDAAIIQPAQFVTFDDYKNSHSRIYDFHLKHPRRIFGMFSMNPHFDPDMYYSEAERCVKKMDFVAMKLTPLTHILNPSVIRARLPFETARALNVPLMIHQGHGMPWTLMSCYYGLFKEFSDVTIVLAHCGTMDNETEDVIVAKECDNVYLECSVRGPNIHNIQYFVREIGSSRVMFASDSPDEMAHIIWNCRNGGFTASQVDDLLGNTACTAFRLEGKI